MKYIAYCMLHKQWFTKETLKLKCQHLDKQHIKMKEKNKRTRQKCRYLVLVENEVKDGNISSNNTNNQC